MVLMVLGVNYQTAPIQIREQLAFDFEAGAEAARVLVEKAVVTEAVLVSTCNRTELYCKGQDGLVILETLIGHCGLSYEQLKPYTYIHSDIGAVKHLMRVASGLDSMVLGEGEILGQVKRAYTASANIGVVGKYLGRLFQTTFAIAKEVRTETGIGINPVSVAYVAARLTQQIFSDLSKTRVLLVGAGDLIHLTIQHLVGMGVQKVMIANRTLQHAKRLALEFSGDALKLEQIPENLPYADMVVTGTGSPKIILSKEMILQAVRQRKRRPMLLVDLSVPRDIDPAVAECEDIYLYGIDDLQNIVEENRRVRSVAARGAEEMISIAANQFMDWCMAQDSFRTLTVFRQKFEKIRDQILQESLYRLKLGETPETLLQKLAFRLTNQFLHEPTCRLRLAGFKQEEILLALTRELFELNHETIDTK